MIFYFISLLMLNYILFSLNNTIAQKINLFDRPDKQRKFHKTKTPITGGIIIFVNLFIFYLFNYFGFFSEINLFNNKFELNFFCLSCFLIFLLGFVDDKINISANAYYFLLMP